MTRQLLSVVVPVLNEEDNIVPFHRVLAPVIDGLDLETEVIYVDDGSTDGTYSEVVSLAAEDDRIKCVRFSRNFGSHAAMLAGFKAAKGDAVVGIAVDLQDPPAIISRLIDRWREGYHVVWAVRETRHDPYFKKLLAGAFYRLFRKIALPNYPENGMDLGLYDRTVIDNLDKMSERHAFLPAQIVWLGFRQTHIPYERSERQRGVSKWSVGRRITAAIDAIVSFSHVPIRLISYTGIAVSGLSFCYASLLFARKLIWNLGGDGWASLMVAMMFLGGVQLVMLGMLGEYIWRGIEQVKGRPPYVIMDGFGTDTTQVRSDEKDTSELYSLSD